MFAVIVGIILGFIGGPAIILLPWGIVSFIIGTVSTNKKWATANGAVFGFVASFVFMLSGYDGHTALFTRFVPFAIIGLFGAICGLVLSLLGHVVYRRIRHDK